MADKSASPDGQSTAAAQTPAPTPPPPPPKRGPGHRGAEVRDTVAEMAAKAHEISLEAGSKMAAAMKDVVNAAAGLTDFVVESARDLVQYMVRRGQMTQEEADKLIRRAEEAQAGRPPRPAHAPAATAKTAAPMSGTALSVKAILSEQQETPARSTRPGDGGRATATRAAKDREKKKVVAAKVPAAAKKAAMKPGTKTTVKAAAKMAVKPAAKKSSGKASPSTAKKATAKKKK